MSRVNGGQADGRSQLSLSDRDNDKPAKNHKKCDELINNRAVSPHVNHPASSLVCTPHPNPSENFSVKTDIHQGTLHNGLDISSSSFKVADDLKTSIKCSIGTNDDSEEERPGSFDYMPSHCGHVKASNISCPSDVKLSNITRSLASDHPLSKTSVSQTGSGLVEEGGILPCSEVPKSYSKHSHNHWDYMPCGKHSDDESDVEDEEDHKCGSSVPLLPRTHCTQVDDAISYNLKPVNRSGTGSTPQRLTSLYNLYQNQYFSEVSKEKDKKNKNRDDDKSDLPGLVDVNGNQRLLDSATYLQMRQVPGSKSESTASGNLVSHPSVTISHSHSSSTGSLDFDRRKERKRMKLERLKGKPAEEYKGYRKFKDIKEILDFVEGSSTSSKTENKASKKKQERSRKKDHHPNGPVTSEGLARGDDTNSTDESALVTSVIPSSRAMGNSFGRSLGENVSKIEAVENDLEKRNKEFHSCLNSLPPELVISDKDHTVLNSDHEKSSNKFGNIKKSCQKCAETASPDSSITGGSNLEKNVAYIDKSVNKKTPKTKKKKDKLEIARSKSNMVKSLEMEDFSLQSSIQTDKGRSGFSSTEREVPPDLKREDSFTEVKKRKKRAGVKDLHVFPASHTSNHHFQNNRGLSHPAKPHTNTPAPPPPPHMVNMASSVVSNISYLPVNGQAHLPRDLSPSAFPVLSSHGSLALCTEARRSSCGDLNSDFTDNKTYDSDRESAKSLPDARGIPVCGDMLPVYPISYARMAAAPCKNDSANSPSFESGVSSWSQKSSVNSSTTHTLSSSTDIAAPHSPSNRAVTPERKTTVWKGSPRERRHSIGSSPEDKADGEKSSVAQSSRQCGSQEVISRYMSSLVAVSKNDTVSTETLSRLAHNDQCCSSLQADADLQEKVVRLTDPASDQTESAASYRLQPQMQATGRKDSIEHAASSNIQRPQTSPTSTFQTTVSSCPGHAASLTISAEREDKAKTEPRGASTARTASTSSIPAPVLDATQKSSKTKSVIFLDKRFDASPPPDFGITFGFDSRFETTCDQSDQTASQQPVQSQTVVVHSLSQNSSVPPPVLDPVVSQGFSYTPSLTDTASAQTLSNIPSHCSESNSQVPKDPHIQGPRNGLIVSSSLAGSGPVPRGQVTSCRNSVSSSTDNSNPRLVASGRTSSVVNLVLSLSSVKNPDQLVMPELSGSSAATLPVSQVNKSTAYSGSGADILSNNVQTNSTGVTDSLSQPTLPVPHAVVEVTSDKNSPVHSTSLPLSALENKEPMPECKSDPEPEGPSLTECTSTSLKAGATHTETSTRKEAKSSSQAQTTASTSVATDAALQQPPPVAAEVLSLSKPVIYGLNIRPGIGCGKLMFVHSGTVKCSGNMAEVSSFLRKKWSDDVIQKRGPNSFRTYSED